MVVGRVFCCGEILTDVVYLRVRLDMKFEFVVVK